MLNLTRLSADLLGVLRKRLGVEPTDDSRDGTIANYTPEKVAGEWCAWELGDSSWAHAVLLVHEQAKNAMKEGTSAQS